VLARPPNADVLLCGVFPAHGDTCVTRSVPPQALGVNM
jgi:hypothetical protein